MTFDPEQNRIQTERPEWKDQTSFSKSDKERVQDLVDYQDIDNIRTSIATFTAAKETP